MSATGEAKDGTSRRRAMACGRPAEMALRRRRKEAA
jgi:hypothetical protein